MTVRPAPHGPASAWLGILPLFFAPVAGAATGGAEPSGPASVVVVVALALIGGSLLLLANQRLRRRLRQETQQRLLAETALIKKRNELKRQVDDRTNILHQLSFYDPLTDLPNRSLLYDRLTHASHTYRREGKAFALILIDLNGFKAINDTLGHYIGDSVLQEVAVRLQQVVNTETIFYLGGDEFAIMHSLADCMAAPEALAQQVNAALAAPFMAKGLPIAVGAGIGIAYYPEHTTDADNLLRYAEIAMYSAKRTQDEFAIYDPAQRTDTKSNLVLAGELRSAIGDGELLLHYQPKVDVATGRVVGLESLVRWHHPREGLMSPERFVQLAERTGLVRPLTLWVLNSVMQQSATWRDRGITLPIAVNFSVLNLHDPHLQLQVAELLDAWDLPGDAIEIEVTESAAIDDPDRAAATLTRLSRLGISIAIDDFGTGYSSLAYLKRLPLDAVKIDKSFVMGMLHDGDNDAIVRTTIDLAHNLGLRVVAEGIEDRATWNRLAQLQCDHAQGFFISQPLDADAITAWLTRHPARSRRAAPSAALSPA